MYFLNFKSLNFLKVLIVFVASAALFGCASRPDTLEVDVQSFAVGQTVKTPQGYRLQWLPTQNPNSNFGPLEAAAQKALAQAGLHRIGADGRPLNEGAPVAARQANLTAQLSTGVVRARSCPSSPEEPAGAAADRRVSVGVGLGWWDGPLGLGIHLNDFIGRSNCYAVKIILRDTKRQNVVYESTAQFESWNTLEEDIWGILFEAAMRDFPQGNSQKRTIVIDLKNRITP